MSRALVQGEEALREMAVGMRHTIEHMYIDHSDTNFRGTDERFARYLEAYCQPYDPSDDLSVTFDTTFQQKYQHGIVLQRDIPFSAVCAHHLLPFLGAAHVAYIPKYKVVGLSKLSRLVYGVSHHTPGIQETIGERIVDALMEHLGAQGAFCMISAEHGCMAARGIEKPGVKTVTAHLRGVFEEEAPRNEVYQLLKI